MKKSAKSKDQDVDVFGFGRKMTGLSSKPFEEEAGFFDQTEDNSFDPEMTQITNELTREANSNKKNHFMDRSIDIFDSPEFLSKPA